MANRSVVAETAGICIVRDAIDIVPFLCGHYLRIGFERLHFIDDGSSDGTFEFLGALAEKMPRVTVERFLDGVMRQQEAMNAAVSRMTGEGARTIFPFDADEFWNVEHDLLRHLASDRTPRAFKGRWLNFVQSRRRACPTPFGLLSVRHRAEPVAGVGMAEVVGLREPFVCLETMWKTAFWTDAPVALSLGQHLLLGGPPGDDAHQLELFHLPLRYKSELTKRALNYEPRRAPLRTDPLRSWQSNFHREVVLGGRDGAVWAANSADRQGRLDVYGTPRELVRDDRLRTVFIKASLHMLRHFGMLVV